MTPCVCHCAACRADGHGIGACVVLCAGLHDVFDGKADVVDLVLRHGAARSGACRWGAARFGAVILCVQYGPAGDVIAAGDQHGHIHDTSHLRTDGREHFEQPAGEQQNIWPACDHRQGGRLELGFLFQVAS